jgi:methionyl-tRNA formyltransferase
MKKKILLCINNDLGLKIFKLLKNKHELTVFTSNKDIKAEFYIKSKKDFLFKLKKLEETFDFVILVYWPYLIPKILFYLFKDSINFHPSYLPWNRGWYPHVIAKIKRNIYGISLHQINKSVDNGKIWVQKKLHISLTQDSYEIYNLAKKNFYYLFRDNINKILNGKIKPKKQKKKLKLYSKSYINKFDLLSLKKKMKIEDFINLGLARKFKDKSYLYFYYKKKKYQLNIKIHKIKN